MDLHSSTYRHPARQEPFVDNDFFFFSSYIFGFFTKTQVSISVWIQSRISIWFHFFNVSVFIRVPCGFYYYSLKWFLMENKLNTFFVICAENSYWHYFLGVLEKLGQKCDLLIIHSLILFQMEILKIFPEKHLTITCLQISWFHITVSRYQVWWIMSINSILRKLRHGYHKYEANLSFM